MRSIDFYYFKQFSILGPNPAENFNQLGLKLGRYLGDRFRLQLQEGIAPVWGTKRTDVIRSRTTGFLAQLHMRRSTFFLLVSH